MVVDFGHQGGTFSSVSCSWVVFVDFEMSKAGMLRSLRQASHIAAKTSCELIISERDTLPPSIEDMVLAAFQEVLPLVRSTNSHVLYLNTNAFILSDPLHYLRHITANTIVVRQLPPSDPFNDTTGLPAFDLSVMVLPVLLLRQHLFSMLNQNQHHHQKFPLSLSHIITHPDPEGIKWTILPTPIALVQHVWRQEAGAGLAILLMGSAAASLVDLYPTHNTDPYAILTPFLQPHCDGNEGDRSSSGGYCVGGGVENESENEGAGAGAEEGYFGCELRTMVPETAAPIPPTNDRSDNENGRISSDCVAEAVVADSSDSGTSSCCCAKQQSKMVMSVLGIPLVQATSVDISLKDFCRRVIGVSVLPQVLCLPDSMPA
jgi:hypothetical protein